MQTFCVNGQLFTVRLQYFRAKVNPVAVNRQTFHDAFDLSTVNRQNSRAKYYSTVANIFCSLLKVNWLLSI